MSDELKLSPKIMELAQEMADIKNGVEATEEADSEDKGIEFKPGKWFAIVDNEYMMQYIGIFTGPVEATQKAPPTPGEIMWLLEEADALEWVQQVEAHPNPNSFFAIWVKNGHFTYLGQALDETELLNDYAKREDNPLAVGDQYVLVTRDQAEQWIMALEEAGVEYTKMIGDN